MRRNSKRAFVKKCYLSFPLDETNRDACCRMFCLFLRDCKYLFCTELTLLFFLSFSLFFFLLAQFQVAYQNLTPDYTHQGDLNLIIKLGDFETNPLRSDTVDWRGKMDLHTRHVGNDAVLKGSFKPYLTTNAAAPLFQKILEENECKSVCRSHLDVERGSQLLHTLRRGA